MDTDRTTACAPRSLAAMAARLIGTIMWSAPVAWIVLVVMAGDLAAAVPDADGFGPEVCGRWMDRLDVLAHCAWLVAVGLGVVHLNSAFRTSR
jgi:hypothetical protein